MKITKAAGLNPADILSHTKIIKMSENKKVLAEELAEERQKEENEILLNVPPTDPRDTLKLMEEINRLNKLTIELEQKTIELEKTNIKVVSKGLEVHEKNQLLMSSKEIAEMQAQFDFEMKTAKTLCDAKAFPVSSPEQAYVIMKAGQEMGLSPIVSLNMLAIINGHISAWGDKRLGYILSKGYKVEYLNETDTQVTVRIYNDKESYEETATDQDQVIKDKKAIGFAKKNKLRFHAIGMIASFKLPHLFMGIGDTFTKEYLEAQETKEDATIKGKVEVGITGEEVTRLMSEARDIQELEDIYKEHQKMITKNIKLLSAYGGFKKSFEV